MSSNDADEWFTALREAGFTGRLPEKPELEADSADFYRAFWELSPSRPMGFSCGPIPYRAVLAWLDEEGIYNLEDRLLYRRMITRQDIAYLDEKAKQ